MLRAFIAAVALFIFTVTAFAAIGAKDITSQEANSLISKNKNVYILDVRTQQERQQGYIAGSVLIPIDTLERRISEIPKNRPVIVYCAVGSRSRIAAQGLSKNGFSEVYNMKDGIYGWYRNGLPIKQ
ncbi:MAG: rhodanese-like domain-containing protein [Geobacteraceae bacterium]|nr:rhodanese-like domain-containing protein [Geobacteraceae bacterium]